MEEAVVVTKPKRTTKQEVQIVPQTQDSSPDSLLALAVSQNFDIEKLERLIALKERSDKEKARIEFIAALSAFQGECPPLTKNKKVSFDHKDGGGKTEYKYQELADIEKHIRPYLQKHGLSYRWGMKEENGNVSVWLILAHVSGHEETGLPMSGSPDQSGKKNTIQQKSSTVSYLRRYTLTGGLGVASGDIDDDGKGGAKDSSELPFLKDSQLNGAIKAIMEGTYTIESLKLKCRLTEEQESALRKAEEEHKAKKA